MTDLAVRCRFVVLEVYAMLVPDAIEEQLEELRALFGAYL